MKKTNTTKHPLTLIILVTLLILPACSATNSDSSEQLSTITESLNTAKQQIVSLEEEASDLSDQNSKLKETINELKAQLPDMQESKDEQANSKPSQTSDYDKLVEYCKNFLSVQIVDGSAYRLVQPEEDDYPYSEFESKTESVILADYFLEDIDRINPVYEANGISGFDISNMNDFFKIILYNSNNQEQFSHMEILDENWDVVFEATQEELSDPKQLIPTDQISASFNEDSTYVIGTINDEYSVTSFFTIDMADFSIEIFTYDDDYTVWESRAGN